MPSMSQVPNVRNNLQDLLTFDMPSMQNANTNDQNMTNNTQIGHHQQQQWFSNIPNVNPHVTTKSTDSHKDFNQFSIDFNKALFPPSNRQSNAWNNEDRQQPPTWWPSGIQQNIVPPRNYGQNFISNTQNFVRQQYDPYNFAFATTNNSVPHSPTSTINVDVLKQNMQQLQGDGMMNNPMWNNANNKNLMGGDNAIGFNMNNMTVRQTMLNETRRMQNSTPTQANNVR